MSLPNYNLPNQFHSRTKSMTLDLFPTSNNLNSSSSIENNNFYLSNCPHSANTSQSSIPDITLTSTNNNEVNLFTSTLQTQEVIQNTIQQSLQPQSIQQSIQQQQAIQQSYQQHAIQQSYQQQAIQQSIQQQHITQNTIQQAMQQQQNLMYQMNDFSLQLPSEPQVMRTKRMGHRKSSSVSFMPAAIPGVQSSTSLGMHLPFTSINSNFSPRHQKSNSISVINDMNSNNNFLHTTDGSVTQSNIIIPPDHHSPRDSSLPNYSKPHPDHGHRRFHSMGNIGYPYAMPQIFNNSNSFTGHHISASGVNSMFENFNSLNMAMKSNAGGENAGIITSGMRPLHRVQPLMNVSDGHHQQKQSYHSNLNSKMEINSNFQMQPAPKEEETLNQEHDETVVAEDGSQIDEETEQVITICNWEGCNRDMLSQENLVNHILEDHVGSGKASYVCEWTGCSRLCKPFTKRHKIHNHVRIHTGERPFACPIGDCGKKFSRQDGLNTHIKTHSNIKPYVCPCGKAYFHSRSLRKHERTHLENNAAVGDSQFAQEQISVENTFSYQRAQSISLQQSMPNMDHRHIEDEFLMELASLTSPALIQTPNLFAMDNYELTLNSEQPQMANQFPWENSA